MNRSSRLFFITAAVSTLLAVGLGAWLFKVANTPKISGGIANSSETNRVDIAPSGEPSPGKKVTQKVPTSIGAAVAPVPAASQSSTPRLPDASIKSRDLALINNAKQCMEASLGPGDKFRVLERDIRRQPDYSGWVVTLKIFFTQSHNDSISGTEQELIVDRIVIPDSGPESTEQAGPVIEELLRFVVCPLHLAALATTQTGQMAHVSEKEIIERVRHGLVNDPEDPYSKLGPYFRNEDNRKVLVGKVVQLVVEDAAGKIVSKQEQAFQQLASAEANVLIAWSIGTRYHHYLIVKRLN